MRFVATLTALLVAGCAGQPSNPAPQGTAAAPPPVPAPAALAGAAAAGAAPGAAVTPDIEAQRSAAAKNLHLKVVNRDGKQLFCRFNDVTTSRIPRDPVCYTADQLETMQAQQQRELDQLNSQPTRNAKSPFSP
jgi:hypothetical protein